MSSVSAGHIILTPTQPVGSERPQRGSNKGPTDQESRALPTELPHPLETRRLGVCVWGGGQNFRKNSERTDVLPEKSP